MIDPYKFCLMLIFNCLFYRKFMSEKFLKEFEKAKEKGQEKRFVNLLLNIFVLTERFKNKRTKAVFNL